MKTPTARKLPSGSWFVRVQVDGKSQSITRSTKKEAEQAAMALKSGFKKMNASGSCTLHSAFDHYIEARATSSPSTLLGYRRIQKNRFQSMMQADIYKVPDSQWQKMVNAEAKLVSPKYLRNAWMLCAAVIAEETGNPRIKVNLPTVVVPDLNFLSPDEIPIFLSAIEGDLYEAEMLLALHSLRKSEILDMRWSDIDVKAGLIHVHGSAVFGEDQKLIHKKSNKNESSNRIIPIMIPRLADLAEAAPDKDAYIHPGDPNQIYTHVTKCCNKAGVTKCSLHDLRRTFASLCYHLKVSEITCQKLGGWSDYMTLRKVYTKLSQRDQTDEIKRIQQFFTANEKSAPDQDG